LGGVVFNFGVDELKFLREIEAVGFMSPQVDTEAINRLCQLLHHSDLKVVARAGQCLLNLTGGLDALMSTFPKVGVLRQRLLTPVIAMGNTVDAFVFLLNSLKTSQDEKVISLTISSLSSVKYPILPLILEMLSDCDHLFRGRLQEVVSRMSLANVLPYLALFPVMPFEQFFRNALGDKVVDSLYQK